MKLFSKRSIKSVIRSTRPELGCTSGLVKDTEMEKMGHGA
jgi:hypothetical protein